MLGPGVIGEKEFAKQQAAAGGIHNPQGPAINTLGPGFAVSAEVAIVVEPPPQSDDLRVSAKTALQLLAKDPAGYHMVLAGELSRPPATRRMSVLEALLDGAKDPETVEKVSAAMHETNTAKSAPLDDDE